MYVASLRTDKDITILCDVYTTIAELKQVSWYHQIQKDALRITSAKQIRRQLCLCAKL